MYNLYRKSTPGEFQSTPSVWRETVYGISGNVDLNISIHSLRMEGDDITFLHFDVQSISIHSLRMEGDVAESVHFDRRKTFQSTPSVWRETIASNINHTLELSFQSTPSAWRETSRRQCLYPCCGEFQSTPSAWRETRCAGGVFGKSTISIHSLRMEGDYDNTRRTGDTHHFNPLPPHGGRPLVYLR